MEYIGIRSKDNGRKALNMTNVGIHKVNRRRKVMNMERGNDCGLDMVKQDRAMKERVLYLIVGCIGAVGGLIGVNAFLQYMLMSLSLAGRMVTMLTSYWLIALVPILVMIAAKDRLSDYGFQKEGIGKQILVGLAIGLLMTVVLVLPCYLVGHGEYFDNGKRYGEDLWRYLYELSYTVLAIGFTEEFVFRGFCYYNFKKLWNSELGAVIGSSVLFGLFHFLNGNLAQMFLTGLIGAFFCLCRNRIRNCSTVALILAHGVYDFMITLMASLLL